eukprot:6208940-Pleurochrysis_carterae.AAC.2
MALASHGAERLGGGRVRPARLPRAECKDGNEHHLAHAVEERHARRGAHLNAETMREALAVRLGEKKGLGGQVKRESGKDSREREEGGEGEEDGAGEGEEEESRRERGRGGEEEVEEEWEGKAEEKGE